MFRDKVLITLTVHGKYYPGDEVLWLLKRKFGSLLGMPFLNGTLTSRLGWGKIAPGRRCKHFS